MGLPLTCRSACRPCRRAVSASGAVRAIGWSRCAALLCAALLCAALLAAGVAPAAAASFQVSPTRFEFPLSKRFTNFFTVTNNSGESLRIRVTTALLDMDDAGKLVPQTGHPHDLSPWIVLNPRRISLEPGERRVVRFSVRPPPKLPDGEYRTVVFFEELPPRPGERAEAATGFRIQVLTRLGVTIYGRIGESTPDTGLDLRRVTADGEHLKVEGTLHNVGSRHATVSLLGTLVDADEKEVERAEQRYTVQRDQRRPAHLLLPRPPPGSYRVRVEGRVADEIVFTSELPVQVEPPTR